MAEDQALREKWLTEVLNPAPIKQKPADHPDIIKCMDIARCFLPRPEVPQK